MSSLDYEPLPKTFYERGADVVAEELLGKLLVRNLPEGVQKTGMIVETEAYLGTFDKAAHSSKGRTKRTEVLFGEAGIIYVYLVYGIHNLLNMTTGPEGSGVLVRAIEPFENISTKTNGPGLLTKSLDIDRSHTGSDITNSNNDVFIADYNCECSQDGVTVTNRIGIDYAEDWVDAPLRYFLTGNPFVSRIK